MESTQFDTLNVIKELKAGGFTSKQAEAQAKVFSYALKLVEEARLSELATKRDLKGLEASTKKDLKEIEANLKKEMKELETSLMKALKELETNTKLELKNLEVKINESKAETIKWVAGMLIVQGGILISGFFAIVRFLLKA